MAAAAAAPLRKLLLRIRLSKSLPLPTPHLPPQIQRAPTSAPPFPVSIPSQAPAPNLRNLLFSFHPALQIHPSLDPRGDAREGDDNDGAGAEVWADSVKKKRKRKMNKHKLSKLRKRLRRQT